LVMTGIDRAAGLSPGSAVYEARRERPDFVNDTEACRSSVITPVHGLGLSHDLRCAIAARIADQTGQAELAAMYRGLLPANTPHHITAIADGAPPESNDMTAAMVRHADLVTTSPKASMARDIEMLAEAGLSNPQIIALSELIAFVNYEARVVAGLHILSVLP
jgi:uncharacterized protein YciW